jgi:hypothetical protein
MQSHCGKPRTANQSKREFATNGARFSALKKMEDNVISSRKKSGMRHVIFQKLKWNTTCDLPEKNWNTMRNLPEKKRLTTSDG